MFKFDKDQVKAKIKFSFLSFYVDSQDRFHFGLLRKFKCDFFWLVIDFIEMDKIIIQAKLQIYN